MIQENREHIWNKLFTWLRKLCSRFIISCTHLRRKKIRAQLIGLGALLKDTSAMFNHFPSFPISPAGCDLNLLPFDYKPLTKSKPLTNRPQLAHKIQAENPLGSSLCCRLHNWVLCCWVICMGYTCSLHVIDPVLVVADCCY